MSVVSNLAPPPQSLLTSSAMALAAMLFWAILSAWIPGHWSFGVVEAGMLGLGVVWAIRFTLYPYTLNGGKVLLPLAATVVIGLVQLITGHTVNRWETSNAVLRWSAYFAAFVVTSQICSSRNILRSFRHALMYFGFGLSVISVLQLFTSPGQIFWLFPYEYPEGVLGPFVNRDHYAAFIELILPITLFEAMSDRRNMILGSAMAGAMVASVIAGASRTGSVLVIVEVATMIILTSRRHFGSARRAIGVFTSLLIVCIMVFAAVVDWTRLWVRFQDPDPYRGRRELFISALAMVRARPWTGFGLGNFENAYPGYAIFDTGELVDHAHNDWAEWAAEGGVPFLACMVAVAIWSLFRALRCTWGLGVVSVFLHSAVDFPMQRPALALLVFVLLGALGAPKHNKSRDST